MERRRTVNPLVLVTAEVRFLSSALKEREVTGSLKVSKTFRPGSTPGAPVEGSLNW